MNPPESNTPEPDNPKRCTYIVKLADGEGNRDVKITDDLGSFVGRIEEAGLEIIEIKPEKWVARVKVREV